MTTQPKPPETIYIDRPDLVGPHQPLVWSLNRIDASDVEYIRKDLHDAEVERLKAEVNFFRSAF